ncbi:hypothetical protein FOZ62_010304, partial [Perkinsus olseni]
RATRDAVASDVEDVKDGIKDTGAALKSTGASLLRHGRSTATGAVRSFGRALKDGWSSILSKGDDYLDDAAERSQGVFDKATSGAMSGLTSASDRAATTLNRLEEQADRLNTVPSTIDRIQGRAKAMRDDVRSGYDVVAVMAVFGATEGPVGRTIFSSPPNARESMTFTELMMIFGKIDGSPRAV